MGTNVGFIKKQFRGMMQRRGIDPEQFDEKQIDPSLTHGENMQNLREIYGIQDDDPEAYAELKSYKVQHPESGEATDDRLKQFENDLDIMRSKIKKEQHERANLGVGIFGIKSDIAGLSSKVRQTPEVRYVERPAKSSSFAGFHSKIGRARHDTGIFVSEKGRLKHLKKPGIARYIPHPVDVSAEHAKRGGLIGIPEGVDGLRPIRFFESDNKPRERDLLFGNVKRDKKGRRSLF